jgi:hypothetical protein
LAAAKNSKIKKIYSNYLIDLYQKTCPKITFLPRLLKDLPKPNLFNGLYPRSQNIYATFTLISVTKINYSLHLHRKICSTTLPHTHAILKITNPLKKPLLFHLGLLLAIVNLATEIKKIENLLFKAVKN